MFNISDSHEAVHEASSVEQPAVSSPTKSTKLLNALNKVSTWVWESIHLQPKDVLNIKRPRVRDRRLADVRRVEGDHKAEEKYKLLRALAQRSLALQGEKSGYLDIERLCEIVSSRGKKRVNIGRQGKISKYVTYELAIEEEDASFAIRAIQAGMRQLVMERLLKERLGDGGQCCTASGISAFTALTVTPFRYLNYGEIPEFLDNLLQLTSMDLSVKEDEQEIDHSSRPSIADIIKKTSVWYDQLQTYYNKVVDIRADLENYQTNKRMRMQISSSACDHIPKPNGQSQLSGRLITPKQATIQCAIRSPSPCLGENGNIHFRCTGSEGSSGSFEEEFDTPESNLSDSSQDIGPETTDAECTSNITTQIRKSLSARIARSGTSHSWSSMPEMTAWADVPLIEPAPLQALQPDSSNSWANLPAMAVGHVPNTRPLINDIPQPDASDAWADSTAMIAGHVLSNRPLLEIPQPDASDAWANSTAMAADHVLSNCPLLDIPQPDASDAWANSTVMAAGHVSSSRSLFNNVPQPDASDAWANSTAIAADHVLSNRPLFEIPQPDASDAWANSTAMAADHVLSNRPLLDIPQPDASDAWASSTVMAAGHVPSSRSLFNDVPQPDASDAWANSTAMAADHVLSNRPLFEIPQPDASDAWANSTAMAADHVLSNRPLLGIPQPDASDAWANSTAIAADHVLSNRPLLDIPQPDASDAWANSTAIAADHVPSNRHFFPQPNSSDAWVNPYTQMLENTSLDLCMNNVPYSGASDAEVPKTSTVQAPQTSCSNSWANSAGIAAVQFVSNRRNVPHPGASDAWSVVSATDSALTQTSHSDSNAPWANGADVTSVQHPAEVPGVTKKTQPMTGGSSLQPRDQSKSRQYSRVVMVN
ncbi:hypothetical protein N7516_007286 [Penicillium verrucosum]|uniref:uncharacterized protein n=1 Tax=Penicillium verrucosum TaxID=60171 RepID=UPI0025454732|nr:uncharacterized protein N7516_007286 [Penicillium verrucosum]KAJ5932797.1 hypothetical protein N7516_007286 [Penicillium verrucosum]